MLDFLARLQTSRPRFDDGWMLGAAKMQSGYPPAIRAGHKWARTAKAGLGVSKGTPFSSGMNYIVVLNCIHTYESNGIMDKNM